MINSKDDSLIHLSFENIALSENFAKTAVANGYNTLEEILNIPLTKLINMDWFTPAMFEELSKISKQLSAHNSKK